MDEMLTRFKARLDELGVGASVRSTTAAVRGIGRGKVHLVRGASAQAYALLYGQTVTPSDIARAGGADLPALVFTTFAGPRTTETLRRLGVQYLDTAGNAWITFGDVLIDVRGRPRPDPASAPKRGAGNLFSSSRAQVVCALLAWPHLWSAPRRDLARAAGVSLGQAHNAVTLLADAGYEGGRPRPGQPPLLDLWAAAFPAGLAKKLTLAAFHGGVDLVVSRGTVFVSGEKAADDLLRPATLTLYVERLDPRLPIVNRWRTDAEPNIVVRSKFWHAPGGDKAPQGLAVAPWPLVYADLLASDDPRVRGVVTEWRDRHARAT
jgi:hypothetical protein